MESKLDLCAIVTEHFAAGRSEAAAIVIRNADIRHVKDHAWDLVPLVCKYITPEQNEADPAVVHASQEILLHLASCANVKELLLVLLEQADTFNNDIKFFSLLPPIQKCLLHLPGNRTRSFGIVLETLYAHVKSLNLPEDQALEGSERILLDLDENVQRCNTVVNGYLKFFVPFVKQLSWKQKNKKSREQQMKLVQELTKHIVRILDYPLAFLDLTHRKKEPTEKEEPPKSASRLCAEVAISLLCHLQGNIPGTLLRLVDDNEAIERRQKQTDKKKKSAEKRGLSYDELENFTVEEPVSMTGLCVFSYLTFGENLAPACIPQVYTAQYLLELNVLFAVDLLNQKENLLVHKGLKLLRELQVKIPDKVFPALLLEADEVKHVMHVLVKVMTSAKVKELGQMAVQLLKCLLMKFDMEGRNCFLYYMLKSTKHSGICSYLTELIKNEIHENLKLDIPDENFVGNRLWRLLDQVFVLPSGDRTDLLENVDRIMASLNLLRYLILRDKPTENRSGVWSHLDQLQLKYCEILHKALNLSRVHYELELKKTMERSKKSAVDMSFEVSNEIMSGMNKDQQIHAMKVALDTFDMMESILGRITELTDQQQDKSHKVP